MALFGGGGPAGVQVGEFVEPVAFQAVHQPPQDQHPLGPDRVRQPVQVLGGQVVDRRRQGRQPSGEQVECVFGSMTATYSSRHRKASTQTQSGDNPSAARN